jgi:probable F420-dependent oxidoreductase
MVACAVAAEATTTLHVGTLVLDNDFRHPVVLAKEAATLDVLTEGRFEFGLGAGWLTSDYATSGIAMDAPSVRIARMEESLSIMQALWRDGSATFEGEHYRVSDASGTPRPFTAGGPPLVIGGGSKRILSLAGREAEVVSVVPSLAAGEIGPEVAAEAVVEKYRQRVQWARDASGDRDIELQCWTVVVQVVPNADEVFASMAPLFGLTPEQMRSAPLALVGTTAEIADTLRARRAELGFSYIVVHEAEFEALAPVVAELAGT